MANTNPSALEACRLDILSSDDELALKYPPLLAARVARIRDMYNYWLANPSLKDRQIVQQIQARFGVSQSSAYSDLAIIQQLVPLITKKSREFHLARSNEMLLETYNMAKARKDTKTMERAATSYGKQNGVDKEIEQSLPYDDIVPQPFAATIDVSVLGIKPIPNVADKIAKLTKELSRDNSDIIDVEFESVDLEEEHVFKSPDNGINVQS